MGLLDFLKSDQTKLDEKYATLDSIEANWKKSDSTYQQLKVDSPWMITPEQDQAHEAVREALANARSQLDQQKQAMATPSVSAPSGDVPGFMKFLQPVEGLGGGISRELPPEGVEPATDLLKQTFVEPAASLASGVYGASARFTNVLDQWSKYISDATGLDRGGAFEVATKEFERLSQEFAEAGVKGEDIPSKISQYLYEGIGQATFDLPLIATMGLPAFSAVGGGGEAIQSNYDVESAKIVLENPDQYDENTVAWANSVAGQGLEPKSIFAATVVGGIHGLLLHGALKGAGLLPLPERALAGAGIFGVPTAVNEMEKDPADRDYAMVVSDLLIGAGLTAPGGRALSRKELSENFRRQLGEDFQPLVDRFKILAEDKTLNEYAKKRGEIIARLQQTPDGAAFVKSMRPGETFEEARWRLLHERINERGAKYEIERQRKKGTAIAEEEARQEALAFQRRILGKRIQRRADAEAGRLAIEKEERDYERREEYEEIYLKQLSKENAQMERVDELNLQYMRKQEAFNADLEEIMKRYAAAGEKTTYGGAPPVVKPGKPEFVSETLGVERPTSEVLDMERKLSESLKRVEQVKKQYEGEIPIIGEGERASEIPKDKGEPKKETPELVKPEGEITRREDIQQQPRGEKEAGPSRVPQKTELVAEAEKVVQETKGKLGDESLTGRGYELGVKARTDKEAAEKIDRGLKEMDEHIAGLKESGAEAQEVYNAGIARQYYREAKEASESTGSFKDAVEKGEIEAETGKLITKKPEVPEPIDVQFKRAAKKAAEKPKEPEKPAVNVIKFPSGRWGYAGKVEETLLYESIRTGSDITPHDIANIKSSSNPAMAAKLLEVRERSFDTKQEAIDFANERGIPVVGQKKKKPSDEAVEEKVSQVIKRAKRKAALAGKEAENIRQAVNQIGKINSKDLEDHGISNKEDANLLMQIGSKDGLRIDDAAKTLIRDPEQNPKGLLPETPPDMNPTDWLIENIRNNTRLKPITEKELDRKQLEHEFTELERRGAIENIDIKQFEKMAKANKNPEKISLEELEVGDKFTIGGEKFKVTKETESEITVKDSKTYELDKVFDKITIDEGSLVKAGIGKETIPERVKRRSDALKPSKNRLTFVEKEPHELTRSVYIKQKQEELLAKGQEDKNVSVQSAAKSDRFKKQAMVAHRGHVEKALEEGKTVSDEVLKPYPDLLRLKRDQQKMDEFAESGIVPEEFAQSKKENAKLRREIEESQPIGKFKEGDKIVDIENDKQLEVTSKMGELVEITDMSTGQSFPISTDSSRRFRYLDPEKRISKPAKKPKGKKSLVESYIELDTGPKSGNFERQALNNYANRFIAHLERKLKSQPYRDPKLYLKGSPYEKSDAKLGGIYRDLIKLKDMGLVDVYYNHKGEPIYGLKGKTPPDYMTRVYTEAQAKEKFGSITEQEKLEKEFIKKKAAEGEDVTKPGQQRRREAREQRLSEGQDDLFTTSEKKKQGDIFSSQAGGPGSGGGSLGRTIKSDMQMSPRKDPNLKESDLNNPITLRQIGKRLAQEMEYELGKDVRFGLIKRFKRRAKGLFHPESGIIRVNNINDLQTLSHEIGHYLDIGVFKIEDRFKYDKSDFAINTSFGIKDPAKRAKRIETLKKKYGSELVDSLQDRYELRQELKSLLRQVGYPKVKNAFQEGIAEFTRLYVTDPKMTRKVAPKFYNLFEAILDDQPQFKSALKNAREWYDQYRKQDPLVLGASLINRTSEQNRLLSAIKATKEGFFINLIDGTAPFRELQRQLLKKIPDLRGSEDPLLNVLSMLGIEGKVEGFFHFHPHRKAGNEIELRKDIKPLFGTRKRPGILYPILQKGNLPGIEVYLMARRNLELGKRGLTDAMTASVNDSHRMVDRARERYGQEYLEGLESDLKAYQTAVLDYYLDSGKIGKDTYDKILKLNQFYVPFKRFFDEFEDTGQFPNLSKALRPYSPSPVKGIRGSEREIVSPFGSIIKNTYDLLTAADRNSTLKSIIQALNTIDPALAQRIPARVMRPVKVIAEPKQILDPVTGEVLISPPENFTETKIAVEYKAPPNMQIVTVWEQGKEQYYQIPKKHYDAFFALNEPVNKFVRLLSMPSRVLQAGAVVYDPTFAVRNIFRDQLSAWFYTKYNYNPFYFLKGVTDAIGKSDVYQKFLASGADQSFLTAMDKEMSRGYIEKRAGRRIKTKFQEYKRNPLLFLQDINRASELGTRVGAFRNAYRQTGDPYLAMQEGREISGDYGVKGKAMRNVSPLYPFLNARTQHAKLLPQSAIRRGAAGFIARGLPISAAAMANWYMNHADDEVRRYYNQLPTWRKIGFFNVHIPFTDTFLPVPRGPVGILFGATVEHALDKIEGEDPETIGEIGAEFLDDYLPTGLPTEGPRLATELTPFAFRPIIEQAMNKVGYTGKPIVRKSLQGLDLRDQYEDWTSETFKFLGKQIDMSPVRMQHLFTAYTAGAGRGLLNIWDDTLEMIGFTDAKPLDTFTRLSRYPLTRAFITETPLGRRGKSVQDFYRKLDQMETVNRTVNAYIKDDSMFKVASYLEDSERAKDYTWYIENRRTIGWFREALSIASFMRHDIATSDVYKNKREMYKVLDNAITNVAIRFNEAYEDGKVWMPGDILMSLFEFGREVKGETLGARKQFSAEIRSQAELEQALNRLNLYKLRDRAGKLPRIDFYRMKALQAKLDRLNKQFVN